MTAARKPQSQGSRELMHEMSIWATQHRPKLILTEYMRRLVLAQPPDPLEFLKNEIRTNPVVPGPYNIEEPDKRPIAEQEKRLDVRSLNTKKAALRRVFDRFANKEGLVKVAKLLVDCEENPTILLEACPKHARDLPLALEKVVTDGGLMDWAAFRDCGLLCMSQPGCRRARRPTKRRRIGDGGMAQLIDRPPAVVRLIPNVPVLLPELVVARLQEEEREEARDVLRRVESIDRWRSPAVAPAAASRRPAP